MGDQDQALRCCVCHREIMTAEMVKEYLPPDVYREGVTCSAECREVAKRLEEAGDAIISEEDLDPFE